MDIFGSDAEQVERVIAYSMTKAVKYITNFIFNLGKKQQMVKWLLLICIKQYYDYIGVK